MTRYCYKIDTGTRRNANIDVVWLGDAELRPMQGVWCVCVQATKLQIGICTSIRKKNGIF